MDFRIYVAIFPGEIEGVEFFDGFGRICANKWNNKESNGTSGKNSLEKIVSFFCK